MSTQSKHVADILRRVSNIEKPKTIELNEHQEAVRQQLIESIGIISHRRLREERGRIEEDSGVLPHFSVQAQEVPTPNAHDAVVTAMRRTANLNCGLSGFICGSTTGQVLLWDAKTNEFDATKFSRNQGISHSGRVTAISQECTQSVNHAIATGSSDGDIKIWTDGAPGVLSMSHDSFRFASQVSKKVIYTGFIPAIESVLVTSTLDGTWALWDTNRSSDSMQNTHIPVFSQKWETEITCSDIQSDGALFVCGNENGAVSLWDFRSGEIALSMESAHNSRLTRIVMHPSDGHSMATASTDGVVKLWSLRYPKEPLNAFAAHKGIISDMRFSNEYHTFGPALVTSGFDSLMKLWNYDALRISGDVSSIKDRGLLQSFKLRGKVAACEIASQKSCKNAEDAIVEGKIAGASGTELKMWNVSFTRQSDPEIVQNQEDVIYSDEDELEALLQAQS